MKRSLAACVLFAASLTSVGAQDPDLKPRRVTFLKQQLMLSEALEQLQKQTGNVVNDARTNRTDPTIVVPAGATDFWPALDAIGKASGIGFSMYQADGGVALIDRKFRAGIVDYRDRFRFAFKRITTSWDDDTQAHLCHVAFDVAWEPRIRPLYLQVADAEIAYKKGGKIWREKLGPQAERNVSGTGSTDFELRADAPDRKETTLEKVSGTLRVISAPKMLDFRFVKPAAGAKEQQEGVKLRLADFKQLPKRWEADVEFDYPKDAIIPLSSYQSWMHNNRIWLSWMDASTKKQFELECKDNERPSKSGPGIVYVFEPTEQTPLPPTNAVVTLHYRTPNRVVVFTVPFAFQDLPLP